MARPKKAEKEAKEPEVAQISRDDFIRTRDSVVTGLTSLQAAVQDLARAYIDHTDTVLGRKGEGSSLTQFNLATKPLGGETGFFSARGPTPAPAPEAPVEGKKRKRAPHDKNAPKRALTPFFLYLQSERANIGSQLGQSHTAKEVQDEGGKRWREMPEQEKAKWQEEYGVNFARYQEHMKAYKAGQPLPVISDAEAKKLHERNKTEKAAKPSKTATPAPIAAVAPIEDDDDDDDDDDDSSSDEESPEPVKEPTPPPAKKQKTKDSAKKKAAAAKIDEPTLDPLLRAPAVALPEKKKKSSKKEKEKDKVASASAPVVATPKTVEPEPKPKKKGRKHKSGDLEN